MATLHDSNGNGIGQENPLAVRQVQSDVILPVDIQSRYAQTVQTHNAVSIPTVTYSQSAWIDTDGFDKLSLSCHVDASVTHQVSLHWSTDGTNVHTKDIAILPASTVPDRAIEVPTKLRYARVELYNGDTIAHTMSSWAYLKA